MKTFIIAEAGVNHNGSLEAAKALIEVAVAAGADAVKFQTFQADKLVTEAAPKAAYQLATTSAVESQYEMIKKLELSRADHEALIAHCQQHQIQFLSTPFDIESVDLLANAFNLPLLKIPSGEITNAPLLLAAARTQKPVILSTGMSTVEDIESALGVLAFGYSASLRTKPSRVKFQQAYRSAAGKRALKQYVTLLHCTTEYPAPFSSVNLRAIDTLRSTFSLPVGYSDHTLGIEVAIAAVARGATVIEKHFTLDRQLPGPDHLASLEPHELIAMVQAIRHIEVALGDGEKMPSAAEMSNRIAARKSLVALAAIRKGDVLTEHNIGLKRPGNGIAGMQYWERLGTASTRDYQEHELISDE